MDLSIILILAECEIDNERVILYVNSDTDLGGYGIQYSSNGKTYRFPSLQVKREEIVQVITRMGKDISYTPRGYVQIHEIYLNESKPLLCGRNGVNIVKIP